MKFSKETLQELADALTGEVIEGIEVISNEIIDNNRWSVIYAIIFKSGDHFYSSSYSTGATEIQDEYPYDNDDDEIECTEVYPHQVTVTHYLKKKPL